MSGLSVPLASISTDTNTPPPPPPPFVHPSSSKSLPSADESSDDSDSDSDDEGGRSIDISLTDQAFSIVSLSVGSIASVDSLSSAESISADGSKKASRTVVKRSPLNSKTAAPGGIIGIAEEKGSGKKKKKSTRSGSGRQSKDSWVGSWWAKVRNSGRQGQDHHHQVGEKKSSGGDDTSPSSEEVYPDGGLRAWLIVFGAMCNTFSTFGYVNSWGIFQAYYQTTILSHSSPSNIAWIGSIQYALVFFPGLITGRLFDLGYFHSIFTTCSVLLVLATFLIAECKVYWHFLLCQGFTVGLACGGIFGPTIGVIAHWFKKRRGIAMGLVAVGASVGGTILPIAAQNLISLVGFQWTMRIIGFILILTLTLSNLTLRRRLAPKNAPGGLLNLSAFLSPAFSVYCLSAFTTFMGIYTVLTYIDVSAERVEGVKGTRLAFYLVSVANAASLVGRYIAGVMSDRVGPMNVMIPFTTVAGVMTILWPYVKSRAELVAIAVVYGFCSGSYVSLISNPMMEFGDTKDVGRRIGMFMSILAVGALGGPPISGAICRATGGGFEVVGMYAGSMVLLGVGMMVLTRWLVLRRWWGRM